MWNDRIMPQRVKPISECIVGSIQVNPDCSSVNTAFIGLTQNFIDYSQHYYYVNVCSMCQQWMRPQPISVAKTTHGEN